MQITENETNLLRNLERFSEHMVKYAELSDKRVQNLKSIFELKSTLSPEEYNDIIRAFLYTYENYLGAIYHESSNLMYQIIRENIADADHSGL